jgi:hypothetical protein
MFRNVQRRIGARWCGLMHESLMWPVHGHYQCRTCGRRYPAFAEAQTASRSEGAAASRALPLSTKAPRATAWLSRA